MKTMKTILESILITVAIFAGMIGLAILICAGEAKIDANAWNNGNCYCGGQYEFSNASHRKNGGNYYYYNCNECGKVIETHTAQTRPSEIHEVAAIVDEINFEEGYTIFVDWNGEGWACDGTDYEMGQLVIIEFDNLGTADIYDDKIIEIRD